MHTTHGITLTDELKEKLDATQCLKKIPYGDVYQSVIHKYNKPNADVLITLILTYNHAERYLRVFYLMDTTTGQRLGYVGALTAKTRKPRITDRHWGRYELRKSTDFLDLFSSHYLRKTRNAALQDVLDRYDWQP